MLFDSLLANLEATNQKLITMKRTLLIGAIVAVAQFSYAQFTSTGGNTTTSDYVGIGTTSPAYSLDISSNYPTIRLNSTSSTEPGAAIRGNSSTWILGWNGLSGQEDISIGTQDNSGSRTLTFATGGSAKMKILSNGNVGIGTTSPQKAFVVSRNDGVITENAIIYNPNTAWGVESIIKAYSDVDEVTIPAVGFGYYRGANNNMGSGFIVKTGTRDALTTKLIVNQLGNVGIGTTSPDALLAVNGTVHAKEVKVDLTGWPDYVFKPKYILPSLKEVKKYIDKNQHLSEMPSETEVVKNGINLGEILKVQTKKIEELTLYVIEQQKQIEILKRDQENNKLQNAHIAILEKALLKRSGK